MADFSQIIFRLRMAAWYTVMAPLELYGRFAGVYRVGCAGAVSARVNLQAATSPVILCYGDSLTEGYGAPKGASYPDRLAELLKLTEVKVINLGRSGETTRDGLDRLASILQLPVIPCTVVVGFGGNDLIRKTPQRETFQNLEAIVTRLHERGCFVVLLGLRGSWLYGIDYHTPFRELAERLGCSLVPVCLDGVWGVPWHMHDVAHPNGRGYRILAGRVAAELARYRALTNPKPATTP